MPSKTYENLDARLDGALLAEKQYVPTKLQVVRVAADTAFEAGEITINQLWALQRRITNIAHIRLGVQAEPDKG